MVTGQLSINKNFCFLKYTVKLKEYFSRKFIHPQFQRLTIPSISYIETVSYTHLAPNEWSPEQGPWEDGVAYAQQLVWQLFNETLQAVEVLKKADIKIENTFASELTDKFLKLDNGVDIGSWGQIKEWKEDEGQLDFQGNDHRHLSQLIALYPGNQISYQRDSWLADAAKVTLQSRGDMGTGWSLSLIHIAC